MKNFKKVLALVLVVALSVSTGIMGTLAYLTDRDSKVNVFTVGDVAIRLDETFEQGATLLPGADIEKEPTITNTGKNDAWVWATIAFPAAFDKDDASKNVVHFNYKNEYVGEGKWTWHTKSSTDWNVKKDVEIDGVKYNVYTVLYQTALKPGAATEPVMTKVYMDTNVDIAPDGQWYVVENGNVTDVDWNSNTDGSPLIYVSAYAIQKEGFADVYEAYEAYVGQWGGLNAEEDAVMPVFVADSAELEAAIDNGAEEIILESGDYGVVDVRVKRNLTITAAAGAEVKIAGINGQSNNNSSNITIKGVTFDNSLQTEGWYTGTAQNIKPCVGVWGGDYTFENCTFNVTGESKAETGVMSWWTTNKGVMNFINCTFNGGNESARGMQIYGNYDLNVTDCTFNTAKDYSIKYVGDKGCVATFKNNNVNATTNFVQTGSAPYAGADYSLVFENNTLAAGINHIYVDNAENQTITIDGKVKDATAGAIY